MQHLTLSVIIPCYNEEKTLSNIIDRVQQIAADDLALEIIVVDDCSKDASLSAAQAIAKMHNNVRVFHHEVNQGKGAALRTGFSQATGDVVVVQDADLEYDPQDLKELIQPIRSGEADVVLGSRFQSHRVRRVIYFWHTVANKLLTFASNMFTNLNLTDMETCYKMFRREIIQSIRIEENRFGFEPEIVARIARYRRNGERLRIYEVGISYHGRTYAEGKKIGWKDAVRAGYCILKYNLWAK